MAPTIVYVHGNGNKIAADRLRSQWDRALFGRDLGAASRMGYWAPLRYDRPLGEAVWAEAGALTPGADEAQATADPESFIAATLLEAQLEAQKENPAEVAAADSFEAWLRAMTYNAEALAAGESGGTNTGQSDDTNTGQSDDMDTGRSGGTNTGDGDVGAEALPLPRPLRTAAFRALVQRSFQDVYAYFFGGLREPMRRVVRLALAGAGQPLVVVGHSLGTIIAYEALREKDAPEVALFVTAGSPLGVTEVQDLLEHPLRVPDGVREWRNVSDARDLVALDHRIRPEYSPPDRCADFIVTNDSSNHHGIGEYLRTTPVRDAVLQIFGQEAAARQ
jgi:hypothetical protein